MKTKKRSDTTPQVSEKPNSTVTPKKWYALVFVSIAAIALISGALIWFYGTHALPNTIVAGVNAGNANSDTIRQIVQRQASALRLTFDDNGKKTSVAARDVGIKVDVEATMRQAAGEDRPKNLWQDIQLWQPKEIPLVLVNDPGVLIEYARQHFPEVFVDAKEPRITFNNESGHFEVIPGTPGKGLDIKSFERALPSMALRPANFTLKLTSSEVEPLLERTKLDAVRAEADQRLSQPIEFTLHDQSIYRVSPGEIAGWVHFIPDPEKSTVAMEFDEAKIQQFLRDKVGPKVAAPPVDRKVIVDKDNGSQTVIQAGRAGSQLQNVEDLAKNVLSALTARTPFSQNVSIITAPFKTVTLKGSGKWIEVDLSRQRATLYLGDQAVHSFLISSGTARTPTRVGEFSIHSKVASQTMTGTVAGDYFYIPNVKWVSYFDGDEAFHGTYWHNNFGRPMSHGCINMTEANAKTLYDFAPVGTRVVVHR